MGKKIIAWDLGTGGNKASLYDAEGHCLASDFHSYNTTYPNHGWHEQKPSDWWNAVVESTQRLMQKTGVDKNDIVACGISGHSRTCGVTFYPCTTFPTCSIPAARISPVRPAT